MKNPDTAPEHADPAPRNDDGGDSSDGDEPTMLRPCGFPRSYFLKNRGDR